MEHTHPSGDRSRERRIFKPNPMAQGVGIPVREDDMVPAAGLYWVAKLFRVMAALLVLLMVTQLVLGLTSAIEISYGVLIAEALRLTIFAGLLFGAGDLADLFVQSHHDLRAARILLGRLSRIAEDREGAAEPPLDQGGLPRGRGDATH